MSKKTLSLGLAIVMSLFLFAGSTVYANVSGQCSNCHTMHDSQGGSAMAAGTTAGAPYAALLINDCVGCHTTPTTGINDPYDNATPYVRSTAGIATGLNDDACLAGGFFPHDTMGTGDNADNHHGMGNTSDPAGIATGAFYDGSTGLGCGGINGCHGNETDLSDMDAIAGGHHDTSSTYRMLYVGTKTVCGSPAEDYEEAIIKTPATGVVYESTGQNVNIYSAGTVGGTEATISELCGKCHGDFHGAANTQEGTPSEWIRHPSDVALLTGWEMGGVYAFDGNDAKNNPFGYDNATYTGKPTQVTCLSCHRAHGTENQDLLRWGYASGDTTQEQIAGTSSVTYGCLGCHDAQR